MSSYPSAYCIKCKKQTETLGRHTIQFSNNRRAVKGICPICATETYRLLPSKKEKKETQLALISSQSRLPLRYSPTLTGSQVLTPASRLEYGVGGVADKLVHYGVLLVIFGLSIAIGFTICSKFLL